MDEEAPYDPNAALAFITSHFNDLIQALMADAHAHPLHADTAGTHVAVLTQNFQKAIDLAAAARESIAAQRVCHNAKMPIAKQTALFGLGDVPAKKGEEYAPGTGPKLSDHYEVRCESAELGKGSYGVCHMAYHKQSGTRCCMKSVRKAILGRHYIRTFVEKDMFGFLLEVAVNHHHSHVVRHLDFLLGEQTVYTAMEVLHGLDLSTYLREHAPITEGFAQT
ncbi:unnamed protein product, partial [Prorocentrum cordatum]